MYKYYEKIIAGVASSAVQGYTVGSQWTTSKLHALELAKYNTSAVKYHWMEESFDHVCWQIEPLETLESMVDQHVKCIRESYDHVALWFSGGYDSFTILKAFVRNGLKIDELLIQQREWHTDPVMHLDYQTALDSASMVKKHWLPNIKITVVNWGNKNAVLNFFQTQGLDWIYSSAGLTRITNNSRALINQYNPDVKKSQERPGRSVQINGVDKPRVDLRDGRWYATKADSTFYIESSDWCLQFWFLPDLYVKQIWMMIRWLESLSETSHEFVHALQSHNVSNHMYMRWNLAIGRDLPLFSFAQGLNIKLSFGTELQNSESRPLLDVIQSSNPEIYRKFKIGADYMKEITQNIKSQGQHPVSLSKEYFVKNYEISKKEIINV